MPKEFTTKQDVEIKIDIQKATAQILKDNGAPYQKVKAIEECAELIDAISKDSLYSFEGLKPSFSHMNVLQEMADVAISLEVLTHIYGDPSEQIQYKLNRYFERKALKESRHTPWGTRDEKLSGDITKQLSDNTHKPTPLDTKKPCSKCGISARLTYVNQDDELCCKCNPLTCYSARLNP